MLNNVESKTAVKEREWAGQTGESMMRGKTWLWRNDKELETETEAEDCDKHGDLPQVRTEFGRFMLPYSIF